MGKAMAKIASSLRLAAIRLAAALAAMLAIALVAAMALWFGRIRIASAAARAILPHGDGYENFFALKRLDLHGIEIADARLAGFPAAPSFGSLKVEWSPSGLLAKRIDAVSAEGIGIDVSHKVPGFKLPSLAAAGWPASRKDVLMGWEIGSVSASTETLDLSPLLPTNLPPQIATLAAASAKAGARLSFSATFGEGQYRCILDGSLAGLPLHGNMDYDPAEAAGSASLLWSVPRIGPLAGIPAEGLSATLAFSFAEAQGMDLTAKGELRAVPCDWTVPFSANVLPDGSASFSATLDGAHITEGDPLAKTALLAAKELFAAPLPEGLEFSFDAKAEFSLAAGKGAPAWKASAELDGAGISAKVGKLDVGVEGGRLRTAADGCGALVSFAPSAVSFAEASAGNVKFGKSRAFILPEGKSIAITEAAIGFCGGAIRLYALYLNIESLATGFTVFLDDLKMADALEFFPQLKGSSATGRLYGRLPLRLTKEKEIRLGEGFIYTPPGETGNIKLSRPEYLTAFLAQAGVPPPVCANLAKALKNLDYEVFRLDLVNPRGADGRIAVRLQGKSPDGHIVTPVNINVNVNGSIEKFLNLAIKTARMAFQK